MAERLRRPAALSAAQTRLKQLEARLTRLEGQLKTLRSDATGGGATRARLEGLERRAASQLARAQTTVKQSLDALTKSFAVSRVTVGREADRLARAVRAGVRAGSRAYRRSRG